MGGKGKRRRLREERIADKHLKHLASDAGGTTREVTKSDFQEAKMDCVPFKAHNYSTLLHGVPKILISPEAYRDMLFLVGMCDVEISWLGKVEQVGTDFLIKKIYLPKQSCSGAYTEMSMDGLAEMAMEIINDEGADEYAKLRFWGHSHVNMEVSPSGTDEEQTREFKDNEYFIRAIANKKGKIKFDIFFFKLGIYIIDVEWFLQPANVDPAIEGYWKAQMTEKVGRYSGGSGKGMSYFRSADSRPYAGNDDHLIRLPGRPGGPSGSGSSTPSGESSRRGRVIDPSVDFPRLRDNRTANERNGSTVPGSAGSDVEKGADNNGEFFARKPAPQEKRLHEMSDEQLEKINKFIAGEVPEMEIV